MRKIALAGGIGARRRRCRCALIRRARREKAQQDDGGCKPRGCARCFACDERAECGHVVSLREVCVRLATPRPSQAQNRRGDCARHSPFQPGSRLAPPRAWATSGKLLALDFIAAVRLTLPSKDLMSRARARTTSIFACCRLLRATAVQE